jgi:predicted nicotinamide N-methyase
MAPAEEFRGYRLRRHLVTVGGCRFEIIGPEDCEALLDEPRVKARFEKDGYLPYWAELWPAGIVLAQEVWSWGYAKPDQEPPVVLELGSGLGLASLVALRLGYRVIASDYDEDALAFVQENARRNGLPAPLARHVDWRRVYGDLVADRIIAGEVLYEERNLQPVAEFVRRHLRRGGFALVCDACRPTADSFEAVARQCGLSVQVSWVKRRVLEGQSELTVRLYRLEHLSD